MWLICRIINSKTGKQFGSEQFHESNEDLTLGVLELPNTGSLTVKGVSLSESGRPSDDIVWTAAQLSHPVSLVSQFNKPYVVCKFVRDKSDFLLYSCGGPLYYELPLNWPDKMKRLQGKVCLVQHLHTTLARNFQMCAHTVGTLNVLLWMNSNLPSVQYYLYVTGV